MNLSPDLNKHEFLVNLHRNDRLMNSMHSTETGDGSPAKLLGELVRNLPFNTVLNTTDDNEGVISIDGYVITISSCNVERIKTIKKKATSAGYIPGNIVDKWPDFISRSVCAVDLPRNRPLILSKSGTMYLPQNGWTTFVENDKVVCLIPSSAYPNLAIELVISPESLMEL